MTETHPIRLTLARLLAALLLAIPFLLPFAASHAQNGPIRLPVREWQKILDGAESELTQPDISDRRLTALRDQLADLRAKMRAEEEAAEQRAEVLRGDLATLGPAPAEGTPPEAPNLAARRKSLNDELAAAEGATKETGLLLTRAARVAGEIKDLRRSRFTERVFSRSASPLAPSIWNKALPELAAAWSAACDAIQAGLSGSAETEAGEGQSIGWYLAADLILAALLAFPIRSWLIRRYGYVAVIGAPTDTQRLWAALFTGVVGALLPSLAAGVIYLGLLYGEALDDPLIDIARSGLLALVGWFFVAGFCRSALAPHEPDWRLAPIHDYGAKAVSRAVTTLAALFALDRVLAEIGAQYETSVEVIAVQKFVFGLTISAVLLLLLRRRVWLVDGQTALGWGWQPLRLLLTVLVAAIPLTAVLGYVVLSRLLATQLVLTAGLYALVALLRRIADESVDHLLSKEVALGQRLRAGLALGDDGAEMLAFWVSGAVQALIILLGLLALMLLWGVAGRDLLAFTQTAFFGFQVGDIEISLAEILLALALFTALLAATRMLQKFLDQRIFPRTRLDLGMRHSIRSGVGYIGFTLAAMLAVSTVGIDLSNLAIIAGALSVGIGFGLQNIVNNFVSGLILLVERPIKAGDWVVVGEFQGYVKQISVRATEIATFDRASVFIPNSSLISGAVMNRTYADKVGRVLLPIGIAYGADPKRARDVLLDIALAHPEVRRNPPPSVAFLGFGDSALNLELAAFLHDVDKVKSVTSDLCFAIHEALRREGIEIPFPQRDVRVALDEAQLRRIIKEVGNGREGSEAVGR
jgi:small-conductance mechanosensitive channel